jgi:hypothetical protein
MSGLLVASWKEGAEPHVRGQFERAREAFSLLKGLTCTGDASWRSLRVTRFSSPFSPYPAVFEGTGVLSAAAGWVFFQHRTVAPNLFLESLADSFIRDKESAFKTLQGQYLAITAFAPDDAIFGSVDRLGLFPAYTIETEHAVWVSTSSSVLASVLGAPLDVESLQGLFMEGRIRAPRSAFRGIRRLQLGEEFTLIRGRLRLRTSWRPFPPPSRWKRVEEAAEEGSRLLEDTCGRIANYWPRWICDLTSGLDSRLVMAHLSRFAHPPHITVTGAKDNLDVEIARKIATAFGWEFHHVKLPSGSGEVRWPLFERAVGLTDGEIPGHAFDGSLRQKLDYSRDFQAALGGALGELYRDFFWQQEFWRVGRTSHVDLRRLLRYRFLFSTQPDISVFERDWRPDYITDQLNTIKDLLLDMPDALNTAKLDAIYAWKQSGQAGRYQGSAFPLIAVISPLGTSALFEFTASVPWRFRLHGNLVRHMIVRANPILAAMPTWYGGSAEPFAVTRPDVYVPFLLGYGKKLIRKLAQITMHRSVFSDPASRRMDPAWDTGLAVSLDARGFLNVENLRTASLYRPDGLKRFLTSLREGRSKAFDQLFTIASIEILCRQCNITPRG